MALSPSRDQGATQALSPRSPREPLDIPSSSPHAPPATSSAPMSVPNSNKKSPPPPLPPPRYIESTSNNQELVHRSLESENASVASGSVKSGSSLLGGSSGSAKQYTGPQKNIDFTMGSPTAADTRSDGDNTQGDQRMPDLGAVMEYNKLQGEKQMGQRSNERSSAAYDKQVLARIGGPSTPPRSAGALSSSGAGDYDPSSPKSFRDFGGSLRPLSITDRRRSDAAESPRWPPSASSPTFQNLQSPLSDSDPERRTWSRSGPSHNPNASEGQIRSPREGQSHNMPAEQDSAVADDSHLSELNINDKRPLSADDTKTGQKRRAQSPPSATIDPNLRAAEEGQRRENPQVARVQGQEPSSLASSASSALQSGSYQSSYGFSAGSSATSYSSQRPSSSHPPQRPDGQQPSTPQDTPSGQSIQSPTQPHQSPMGPPLTHRRAGSSGIARPPGVFICECCPKKPKKFDNEEELRVHEMEKQYFCSFCHNRFKNKNEAERHQNSLHLRRHSWSCAALQSLEDAFHPTMNSNMATAAAAHAAVTQQQSPNSARFPHATNTDTCGYCGQEFPNPPDWNIRVDHLNHVHKFGECNQSKKFFRADHFRQHLKHSHAGTSGRWTNMLENACMREEPPPQPPAHMPMGIPAPAPMQGMQMQQMQQQMQQQQQQQQSPQQVQQPQPQASQAPPSTQSTQVPHPPQQVPQQQPHQIQSPQQQTQQVQQSAPGAPMTEQQAQQTAQQATQEANQQGSQQSSQPPTTGQDAEQQSQPQQ